MYIYIYIYTHVCVCLYIYIYREREREITATVSYMACVIQLVRDAYGTYTDRVLCHGDVIILIVIKLPGGATVVRDKVSASVICNAMCCPCCYYY